MTDVQTGFGGLGVLVLLIALRMPIGLALIGTSFIGIYALSGWKPAFGIMRIVPYHFASNWHLSSVPMFLFMGYLCYHTGITRGLFRAAQIWLARLPGGLAVASVFGSAGFAAVTGSSVACAAAMGRIAVPEMLNKGYHPGFATGTVAAAGTIGALIPPSILFIIYGIITQQSISKLFIGGAVAGMLTALAYTVTIVLWASARPEMAPRVHDKFTLRERLLATTEVLPVIVLVVAVFGGLFAGLFTPTEAGAIGAFASVLIAIARRELSWARFVSSIHETFVTTSAIFLIAIGANMLVRFVAISGADQVISDFVIGVSENPALLLFGITVLFLLLGMFLDPMGAMLLTLPVLLPVAEAARFDLIWFGVILGKLLEIGMITPPIGMNVFVLKSVVSKEVSLGTIFLGSSVFIVVDLLLVALLMAVPEIITFFANFLS
jgi:tripartite ATP-independent transporter DctM subunit